MFEKFLFVSTTYVFWCSYYMRYVCEDCISEEYSIIPAFILKNWNFKKYSISKKAKELLSTWYEKPVIHIKPNDQALKISFRLRQAVILKRKLHKIFDLMKCEGVEKVIIDTMKEHQYLILKQNLFSMKDLCDINDFSLIYKLKDMFKAYMNTNDESNIPADLFRTTAITAVKYGGLDEYNFVKGLCENPTTPPSVGISAMYAMCASQDKSCIRDTEQFILHKARNQDIVYFFMGQQMNHATRRSSAKFFMNCYQDLEGRYKGNFSFQSVVSAAIGNLSTKGDIEAINKFFEDKDTSRYRLALAQTLDSLGASTAWIERSTTDIAGWLEKQNGKV